MARVSGFTLIELLVVIAIIAILAAILFPVFARARESGKRAKCISNLKQLIVSLHMYADDHKDRYPPTEVQNWPFGDWNDGRATMGLRELNAYVKDTRVFFCPSNRFFKPSVYWKHNAWWCGYCYWGNYLSRNVNPPLTEQEVATRTGHEPMTVLISDIVLTATNGGSMRRTRWAGTATAPRTPSAGTSATTMGTRNGSSSGR